MLLFPSGPVSGELRQFWDPALWVLTAHWKEAGRLVFVLISFPSPLAAWRSQENLHLTVTWIVQRLFSCCCRGTECPHFHLTPLKGRWTTETPKWHRLPSRHFQKLFLKKEEIVNEDILLLSMQTNRKLILFLNKPSRRRKCFLLRLSGLGSEEPLIQFSLKEIHKTS